MNILSIVQAVNSYLSDYILVFILGGCGIYFTLRTGFVQVRCLGKGIRTAISERPSGGHNQIEGMSSFQALATAVAAQIGTGNIVGACGAILTGGPGALMWMWVISFFGMATIYAEAVLAQETRKIDRDGTVQGGPVYYIKRAFRGKSGDYLSAFFAVSVILSLGFIGAMVQSNSIAAVCSNAFGIQPQIMGIAVALGCALIFMGGTSRLAKVTERLVPLMAIIYMAGGLIILAMRIRYIPETIYLIFKYAFFPKAIIGGGVGMALKICISQGVKRGMYSNEAGMGSTPHAHAVAMVKKPHDQGVAAMIGVFIDTFVVLTLTGLIVVSTLYAGGGPLSIHAVPGAAEGIDKTNMVQIAVGSLTSPQAGNIFVAVCLFFFAFSSIIGWNYFGKINVIYLFGKKAVPLYMLICLVFIFLGSVVGSDLVWELGDMFSQLMIIPNVAALVVLGKAVAKHAKAKK